MMMIKRLFFMASVLCCGLTLAAQAMTENDYIRKGNKLYADSLFEKAEIEYRKALELNPTSADAMYNLGNALFNQVPQAEDKGQEAMDQYAAAAKLETDKARLAQIYHNLGTLMYVAQQYPQSVVAYKEALRNNPHDNETRYNLAKAMHMCKSQEQQQENQEQQQQEQQQEQQEQQQQEQQEQQQQEQQNQEQQNPEQQKQEQQQQNQQQAQENKEQISKENAEQILNALMQDEKDIQEKQKKMMKQQQGKTLEKDW